MAIICPACHYENLDGTEFCEACGYELGSAPVSSPTPPPPTQTYPNYPQPTPPPPEQTYPNNPQPAPPPQTYPQPTPIPTSPVNTATTARLISKQPGSPVPEFPLDGSNAIIGIFDPDMGPVEIDLEGFPGNETVSRNHAEIYQEGGLWKIKDLGSTNGVFIKPSGQSRFGARITIPEVLNIGDEVSIAKVRFLFQSP